MFHLSSEWPTGDGVGSRQCDQVLWCDDVMPRPGGFDYAVQGDEVIITHRGRRAGVLRGPAAARFLADVELDDPQLLMARVTGQYRHGNERTARNHPRNRAR